MFKLDDWNDAAIIAAGRHVRHYLNGRLVLDYMDSPSGAVLEGILALQLHTGAPMWTEFKDIRLKVLDDNQTPKPQVSQPVIGPLHRSVQELNVGPVNGYPWLTDDGLTIYWTREDGNANESQIWQATRSSTSTPWENARAVSQGRHCTVTEDNCLMVFLKDALIHQAIRGTSGEPFGEPVPLDAVNQWLDGFKLVPKSPWISADGLLLVFQVNTPVGQPLFVHSVRLNRATGWSLPPQALRMNNHPLLGNSPTWPHLGRDGQTIWFSNAGDRTGKIVKASKTKPGPFGGYEFIKFDDKPLTGRSPRYVEATGELFYTRPVGQFGWELWVLQNDSSS